MKNNFTEPACSRKTVGFVQRYQKQIRFVMRVSFFNMILLSMSLLIKANGVTGQNIDEIYVTIEARNESLKVFLGRITEKTGLQISYLSKQVEPYNNINLTLEERSVKETLDLVLRGTSLSYKQANNYVYIEKTVAEEMENLNVTSSLKIEAFPFVTVSGKVADINGAPMAGVNIIVKGTGMGTTSDIEGKYSINANDNDVLVFTFIGFKTYETQINGRSTIDVSLEEDIKSLQEVEINAGYWQVEDREKTGNISRVSSKDILEQPVYNPLQALHGRVPGVYVQQTSGVPGSNFRIQIRGTNSLINGNDPLFIVDGVPVTSETLSSTHVSSSIMGQGSNPLNTINVSDIESIEVLKDADATAIYGSRGANGVILITTKKGKSGKTNIHLNLYKGFGKVSRKLDLLNTQQYLEVRKEAFKNDGVEPSESNAADLLLWDTTRYTDWQDVLIGGTATTTNAQMSIEGGSATTNFMLSGGFLKETSVFPGDLDYHKGSSHLSITHKAFDEKLNVTFSSNYVFDNNTQPFLDLTLFATSLPPNAPSLYDGDELNWENSTWENPLAYLKRKYRGNTKNFLGNISMSYYITSDLKIISTLGYNDIRMDESILTPSTFYDPAYGFGAEAAASLNSSSNVQSWIVEPQLHFKKEISQGELYVLIGTTFQKQMRNDFVMMGTGFSSNELIEDLRSASSLIMINDSHRDYRYNAAFTRINYNWRGKYILNITGRRDGSSRFGPGRQFANFGAIGGAWIFSNEPFLKNINTVLSFGKIRSSFGVTGNDQIGDYKYLDTYSSTPEYQGIVGLRPSGLFNPDFGWETNKKFEVGMELGFIQDKILLSLSYYKNKSSNQLVNQSLPRTTGFTSIQSNLRAEVENKGIEVELRLLNFKNRLFQWETSLFVTVPRNKLVSFPGLEKSSYFNQFVIGEPLTIKKAYKNKGVDPETGLYQFEDFNNDGVLTSVDDRLIIKPIVQNYHGGFNNSFSFKGFQLDIFVQFVKQTGYGFWHSSPAPTGFRFNRPVSVLDRWQKAGDEASNQVYTTGANGAAFSRFFTFRSGDTSVANASFVRLKNISLSYFLPGNWTKGIKCRFYFQGQNLLLITNYDGLDPENQGSTILPPLRMFTAGVQLTL